jgi:hypothetical protein
MGIAPISMSATRGEPTMEDKAYAITHSDAEWRRILTPE